MGDDAGAGEESLESRMVEGDDGSCTLLSDDRGRRGGRAVVPTRDLRPADELAPPEGEDGGGVSTPTTLRRLLASSLVRERASPLRLPCAPLISATRLPLTADGSLETSGEDPSGVSGSWCETAVASACRLSEGVDVPEARPPGRPGASTLVDADGSAKKSIEGYV